MLSARTVTTQPSTYKKIEHKKAFDLHLHLIYIKKAFEFDLRSPS